MTAPALIAELEELGIRLVVDGGRLFVRGCPPSLTSELRSTLAMRKRELLSYLESGAGRRVAALVSAAPLWADELSPEEAAQAIRRGEALEWTRRARLAHRRRTAVPKDGVA